MFPSVIIIGVGIWRKIRDIDYATLPLAITGRGVAVYHNLLQYGLIREKVDVCSLATSCVADSQNLLFDFISLPFLSLVAFSLIIACLIVYRQIRKESVST